VLGSREKKKYKIIKKGLKVEEWSHELPGSLRFYSSLLSLLSVMHQTVDPVLMRSAILRTTSLMPSKFWGSPADGAGTVPVGTAIPPAAMLTVLEVDVVESSVEVRDRVVEVEVVVRSSLVVGSSLVVVVVLRRVVVGGVYAGVGVGDALRV